MQSYHIVRHTPGPKPKRGRNQTVLGAVPANRPAQALRRFDAEVTLDSKAPNKGRLADGTRVIAVKA